MNKKYRILLLSAGGSIGGEETFTRNLALILLKRGHDVWVVPGGEQQKSDLKKDSIPILDMDITSRQPLQISGCAARLGNYAQNNNIDIMHCQSVGPALMGALCKIRRLKGSEKVWLWHNHGIKAQTYYWGHFFLNHLDGMIAVSDFTKIKMLGSHFDATKVIRIHNGVNIDHWQLEDGQRAAYRNEIRQNLRIPFSSPILGYVGRLSKEKGCDLIISAAKKILQGFPQAHFLIVGDGVMRESLTQSVAAAGLESQVHFTNFQSDVRRYLSAMDCLLQPSREENLGLSIQQAMAIAIPVVASDVGGIPEQVFSGYNGLLCQPDNAGDLAEKTSHLLSDPELGYTMGRRGRAVIQAYLNEDRMVDQIEEVYDRIMRNKNQ